MKILRTELLQLLHRASKSMGKTKLLNLDHFKIECKGYELVITTKRDYEMELIQIHSLESPYDFAAVVPLTLLDIIKVNEAEYVELERDVSKVKVTISDAVYTINCLENDEFPNRFKHFERLHNVMIIDSLELTSVFKKAIKFLSSDELRLNLTGVYFKVFKDGKVKVCSTDANTLWADTTTVIPSVDNWPDGVEFIDFIVPGKWAKDWMALKLKHEPVMVVKGDKNRYNFEFESGIFCCTCIDEKYPDYEKVIPSKFDNIFKIQKSVFKNTVTAASLAANDCTWQAIFDFKENECIVTANDFDLNSSYNYKLKLETNAKQPFRCSFNTRLLQRILSIREGYFITINATTPTKAIVIKDDSGDTALIMPMMINDPLPVVC